MIRCLAIDDEPLALKQLVAYIAKVPYLELVSSCQSAVAAREIILSEQIDAIFVDINMPDLSGMDMVKSLDNPPIVVFTTAYSEYAVEGYKVDAVDYLLKPFGLEDFKAAAEKVKKQYDIRHAEVVMSDVTEDDSIFFKTDYKVVRVKVDEIRYIEGMSEYLKLHLDGDRLPVVVLLSMKKMESRLPASKFMRVHKSFIINLQKIREISKGHIVLEKDSRVPVGDAYKETLQAYIDKKFLGK